METWMYPNLLMFYPELATGTVQYRVNGLKYAQPEKCQGSASSSTRVALGGTCWC